MTAHISILGTGLMGAPMACKLQSCNFSVTAYNRTAAKLEPLLAASVAVATSPAAAIQSSDCTLLMLTNTAAIADLILNETVRPTLASRTLIQMGTIAPSESRDLCEKITAAGGEYLEAPVLGSIPQVKDGSLIVMVGATPDQFERWLPVFQCFGPEPLLMGPVGTAAATKLAMNQLIGSLTNAFALSLRFVQQQDINIEQFMGIVRQSALYAPTFDKKLSRMVAQNYANPNFPTKHLLKDMNLFAREAKALGLDVALAESVSQVAQRAIKRGFAEGDYSALFAAIDLGED